MNNMSEPIPTAVTADRTKKIMTVTWNDGHLSVYPFTLLRAGCPCASCRGGHENMRPDPDPEVFDLVLPDSPAVHLTRVEGAGNYGIIIQWEDGHHHGIYNWHYLRALCPCPQCRQDE